MAGPAKGGAPSFAAAARSGASTPASRNGTASPAPAAAPASATAAAVAASPASSTAAAAAPTAERRKLEALTGATIELSLLPFASGLPPRKKQGVLWAFDAWSSFLVLRQDGSKPGTLTYAVLKSSQITAVAVLAPPAPLANERFLLAPKAGADQRLAARLQRSLAKSAQALAAANPGVPEDVQRVFEKLGKTMPVRWQTGREGGQEMVVMDEVLVREPWTAEGVRGGNERARERVALVLARAWETVKAEQASR